MNWAHLWSRTQGLKTGTSRPSVPINRTSVALKARVTFVAIWTCFSDLLTQIHTHRRTNDQRELNNYKMKEAEATKQVMKTNLKTWWIAYETSCYDHKFNKIKNGHLQNPRKMKLWILHNGSNQIMNFTVMSLMRNLHCWWPF